MAKKDLPSQLQIHAEPFIDSLQVSAWNDTPPPKATVEGLIELLHLFNDLVDSPIEETRYDVLKAIASCADNLQTCPSEDMYEQLKSLVVEYNGLFDHGDDVLNDRCYH
jgi:hypothetical protein